MLLQDKWEAYSQTNEFFEVSSPVSLMSLDVIMKCAFSNSNNCQNEGGTNTYIKAVYELSDLINMRIRVFLYHIDFIFHLSPHGFRFRRACREAHRYTTWRKMSTSLAMSKTKCFPKDLLVLGVAGQAVEEEGDAAGRGVVALKHEGFHLRSNSLIR
ncbi:hypothetical protein CRUP_000920 [Coryphaenoides rupestris]|nr:hypothetical protein CRUP_000920 [Coryphaenoides rupestris]